MINHELKKLDSSGNPLTFSEYIWNKRLHFPMIKLSYLQSEFGIDYQQEMNVTQSDAERDLREVFELSHSLVMESKATNDKDAFLYVVAKDEEMLFKILGLQVQIIRAYMTTGSISEMYDNKGFVMPESIKKYLISNDLTHPRWSVRTPNGNFPKGVDY